MGGTAIALRKMSRHPEASAPPPAATPESATDDSDLGRRARTATTRAATKSTSATSIRTPTRRTTWMTRALRARASRPCRTPATSARTTDVAACRSRLTRWRRADQPSSAAHRRRSATRRGCPSTRAPAARDRRDRRSSRAPRAACRASAANERRACCRSARKSRARPWSRRGTTSSVRRRRAVPRVRREADDSDQRGAVRAPAARAVAVGDPARGQGRHERHGAAEALAAGDGEAAFMRASGSARAPDARPCRADARARVAARAAR